MFISILFTAILLLLPNIVISAPASYSTTELPILEIIPPKLTCMYVTTNIRNRYARTVVKSKYVNPMNQTQGTTFTISLPDTAFISGFVMYKEIDGKKEEIKRQYQQAVESSSRSSLITRDSKTFTITANVEPLSKILFSLTYEQLLQRKYGKYEMIINLYPGQLVNNFQVNVNINETKKIIDLNTPALRSGNEVTEDIKVAKNQFATISKLNNDDTEVNINFSPTVQQQKLIAVRSKGVESKGIAAQFVVEYDIERDPKGGEVIVDDDYFVHYFAPSELKSIPKHVVFVLDVSGSMSGNRIIQLRDAMQVILKELNNDDYFHLVKFSSGVKVWNEGWQNPNTQPQPYLATENNMQKVQDVVKQLVAGGGTNIYDALAAALILTSKGVTNAGSEVQPMIIFLTDGDSSNSDQILKMVDTNNVGKKAAIFSVSFGYDSNQIFLETLANKNSGFMKMIHDGKDASLQLEDFYKEISSPLLTNIRFTYPGQVSNVTNNKFDILFEGSAFAVAGKLTKSSNKFVNVEGKSFNGIQEFIPNYFFINSESSKKTKYANVERLWAYMRIKQLLNKKYEITNIDTNRSPNEEALAIALQYSFVTPVSSIDVVQFNTTKDDDDDPCPKSDLPQQLSNNPIQLKVGERGRPKTEIITDKLPMSGSFYSNRDFLRFGGHSYSTSTSSYDDLEDF